MATAAGQVRYRAGVDEQVERVVAELRSQLERELDRRLAAGVGCWPLLVALVGVLLGIWLLVRRG